MRSLAAGLFYEYTVCILKRGRDKTKICFLATSTFFKPKAEKQKHFTMWTLFLFTLNKARTWLNIDLSGVISTLLNLLVKALCLGSVFLSAHGEAFQEHHLYIQHMFCRPGTGGSFFVQDCLLWLFIFHQGRAKMVDVLGPKRSISIQLLSLKPIEKAVEGTHRWKSKSQLLYILLK